MPLLDHFHPPWVDARPWDGFHATWAAALAEQLNEGRLPPSFFAYPLSKVGTRIEMDVATLNGSETAAPPQGPAGAAVATAVWAPPRPTVDAPVTFTHQDLYEIQIRREDDPFRLTAAIELVSPANKDRESHRRAFCVKCANYLREGVGLIVVDIVTNRSGGLHRELLDLLGLTAAGAGLPESYTAAYRTSGPEEASRLRVWLEGLHLDVPLPTMPLWIMEERCVPVDLEAAYSAARRRLPGRPLQQHHPTLLQPGHDADPPRSRHSVQPALEGHRVDLRARLHRVQHEPLREVVRRKVRRHAVWSRLGQGPHHDWREDEHRHGGRNPRPGRGRLALAPADAGDHGRELHVKEVPADKGYSSVENTEAVFKAGATPFIAFKANTTGAAGGLWEKMFHYLPVPPRRILDALPQAEQRRIDVQHD